MDASDMSFGAAVLAAVGLVGTALVSFWLISKVQLRESEEKTRARRWRLRRALIVLLLMVGCAIGVLRMENQSLRQQLEERVSVNAK